MLITGLTMSRVRLQFAGRTTVTLSKGGPLWETLPISLEDQMNRLVV